MSPVLCERFLLIFLLIGTSDKRRNKTFYAKLKIKRNGNFKTILQFLHFIAYLVTKVEKPFKKCETLYRRSLNVEQSMKIRIPARQSSASEK